MERISTIQTASVITQPVDATEPLTLVEKLEQEVKKLSDLKAKENPDSLEYMFLGHHIVATVNAINIVERHSNWVPVSERLPEDELEVIAVLELTGFYMLAFIRNGIWYNADDGEQIARHKDRQAVTYWMPLPKPPSEVQDANT